MRDGPSVKVRFFTEILHRHQRLFGVKPQFVVPYALLNTLISFLNCILFQDSWQHGFVFAPYHWIDWLVSFLNIKDFYCRFHHRRIVEDLITISLLFRFLRWSNFDDFLDFKHHGQLLSCFLTLSHVLMKLLPVFLWHRHGYVCRQIHVRDLNLLFLPAWRAELWRILLLPFGGTRLWLLIVQLLSSLVELFWRVASPVILLSRFIHLELHHGHWKPIKI